ncbi:3101_t:CDS:2, partial [Acaulospora morrowiae]
MVLFYGLRMKLIWFLNTIWDYAMRNIILLETENFHKRLEDVFDIDEMITLHDHYIKIVYERCLLNEKAVPIHKSILDVLDLTIQFSTLYTRYQSENLSFYDHSRDERPRRHINVDESSDSESDLLLTDEEEDQWNRPGSDGADPLIPAQVDYEAFLEGLSRIDIEFNRNKEEYILT